MVVEYVVIEVFLVVFGILYIILCNGWYIENYLGVFFVVLEYGVFIGLVGVGCVLGVLCKDYVEVVVVVLISEGYFGKVYELVGDDVFILL